MSKAVKFIVFVLGYLCFGVAAYSQTGTPPVLPTVTPIPTSIPTVSPPIDPNILFPAILVFLGTVCSGIGWPLVMIFLILALKPHIPSLLTNVKTFKGPGFEISFNQKLKETENIINKVGYPSALSVHHKELTSKDSDTSETTIISAGDIQLSTVNASNKGDLVPTLQSVISSQLEELKKKRSKMLPNQGAMLIQESWLTLEGILTNLKNIGLSSQPLFTSNDFIDVRENLRDLYDTATLHSEEVTLDSAWVYSDLVMRGIRKIQENLDVFESFELMDKNKSTQKSE